MGEGLGLAALDGDDVEIAQEVEGDAPGECSDQIDNDADGDVDCDDPDCADSDACCVDPYGTGLCDTGATTSGTTTGTTPTGTGPTPEPSFVTQIASSAGGEIKVGHCAVAPGGTIYAVWQVDPGSGQQDIWLSQSTDGGQSFEAALPIENGPINPLGGWGSADRKPYVATDGNRVAVAFGDYPNGSSWLALSTALDPLGFGPLVAVGSPDTADVEEFQKPIFRPDGNLWVAWHWTHGNPVEEDVVISREENGWAYEGISDAAPGATNNSCMQESRKLAQLATLGLLFLFYLLNFVMDIFGYNGD